MRQTLGELSGRLNAPPREAETLIPEEYKAWASLSAQEKTQLVADRLYPVATGTAPFEVQLVYAQPRVLNGVSEPKHNDYPRVRLHAHNDHEAKALYQSLCGITGFDQNHATLECQPVAA